ncbi:MAG: site-specific integrase [Bacteroidales bacterium]
MASIRVKFRESKVEGREGVIYYQIIHDCVIRQIKTEYKLFANEWSQLFSKILITSYTDKRSMYLMRMRDCVKSEVKNIENIIKSHEGYNYGVDDIIKVAESSKQNITLYSYIRELISKLEELGKLRTAETYLSTMNSVMTFLQGEDITIGMIDSYLLERYETFLKDRNVSLNTISFYMRTLRATYNRAVEDDIIEQKFPFKRVYTNIEKTAKRALPPNCVTRLKELEFTESSSLEFARDIFMFSFYTRGMSFIDIAYLRKKDIKNGELKYRRRKTGQMLIIKWEKCMQLLVNKYPNDSTEFLFPIILNNELSYRKQYLKGLATINRHLKKLAEIVDIQSPLTMYVARHSWASIAKQRNIPISVISEGMGHDNETTTQIYLASLDTSILDNANKLILESV